MKIHYVLNGSDENPCTRTTILQQIGRVALLLRILRRESQFAALDVKVMKIPRWKSKFWTLKKQDVQALRSTKMKPAWHREKPQNANRKKRSETAYTPREASFQISSECFVIFCRPAWHREKPHKVNFTRGLVLWFTSQWSARAGAPFGTYSLFREISASVTEVVASEAPEPPYVVHLAQQ